MQPISKTYLATAGTGVQPALSLDWRIAPFSVSYDLVKVTGGGTISVTLETTLDDPSDANAVWTAVGVALTATTRGTLIAPVQAIRANIGTLTGSDVVLKLLQGESIN